jgi:preprotein translocase subunit SecD
MYRMALFGVLILAAIVFVVPTFVRPLPSWWPWQQPVRLGLDLQGGTHLLYGVDIEQAIDTSIDRTVQDLDRELRAAQIGATVDRKERAIVIKVANPDKREAVTELVKTQFPTLAGVPQPDSEGIVEGYTFDERAIQRIRENVREQALKIIRNRIDQFGVAEPVVQAQGSDEIVIQLPGIQDPQRAKELIGRTALLEFKLQAQGPQAGTTDKPGPGVQVLWGKDDSGRRRQYLIEKRTLMTGDVLTDASVGPGSATEGMVVHFELDQRGTKQFAQLTTNSVGRNLAIVLDNQVESAPVIREPITGGSGQISGRFEFAEAQDLANVLRNGALPAPLKLMEERTVGPSLGQDSIRKGTLSFVVGSLAVILFMVLYYRGGGLIADAALVANVLFVLGAFAALGFTLTLPGIAGIVLTVGMAVDANILILERVREELRAGNSARAAVHAGYDRAWSAILDSNVTVLISGLILFQFGTGPVRGFAVTLCLGILTSLLTAVFGTRALYDWRLSGRGVQRVSV